MKVCQTPCVYPCACTLHVACVIQSQGENRTVENKRGKQDTEQIDDPRHVSVVLSGSDARHVVVLRQRRQVLVQLLDALLVCFRSAFAPESLVELLRHICQYTFV
jgi:hypothetical protein